MFHSNLSIWNHFFSNASSPPGSGPLKVLTLVLSYYHRHASPWANHADLMLDVDDCSAPKIHSQSNLWFCALSGCLLSPQKHLIFKLWSATSDHAAETSSTTSYATMGIVKGVGKKMITILTLTKTTFTTNLYVRWQCRKSSCWTANVWSGGRRRVWLHSPPVSMRAHLHMQLSLSMSLVLKSAPWMTRLLCLPAVPLWLFRNSLKHITGEERRGGEEEEGGVSAISNKDSKET